MRTALPRSYPTADSCVADPLNPCSVNTPCTEDAAWCSSGMALAFGLIAKPTPVYNTWTCSALQVPAGALPQGNEFQCFDSQAHCEAPPAAGSLWSNPCSASGVDYVGVRSVQWDSITQRPLQYRCQQNALFCSGGLATGSGHVWTCPASYQLNALPNPDGVMCFTDFDSCTMSGANSCTRPLVTKHRCSMLTCLAVQVLAATCHPVQT